MRSVLAPCDRCGCECFGDPDSHVVMIPEPFPLFGHESQVLYACESCWPIVKKSCEQVGVVVDQPRAFRRRLQRRR